LIENDLGLTFGQLQSERYWKTREDEERGKIEQINARRLEEASQDAFATEIWKCENVNPRHLSVLLDVRN